MRLLIVSDIHDHVWHLAAMLAAAPASDRLVVCGDLCAPFVAAQLAEAYTGPIHLVFGNNDGDHFRITQLADRHPHVWLHGELLEADWDGLRVAVNHYPEIARPLAASGAYDVVCYGHDHRYAVHRHADTWLLNPGPVMGYAPADRADVPATCLLYDSDTDRVQGYRLADDGAAMVEMD